MIDHRNLPYGDLIERDALTDELAAEIRTRLWLRNNIAETEPQVAPVLDALADISLETAILI